MGYDSNRFKKQLTDVVNFGKHRGKTLKQICKEGPDYIEWLAFNTKQYHLDRLADDVKYEARKYGADFIPK